jgi:hypothetical protein
LTVTVCAKRESDGKITSQQKIRALVTRIFYRGTEF